MLTMEASVPDSRQSLVVQRPSTVMVRYAGTFKVRNVGSPAPLGPTHSRYLGSSRMFSPPWANLRFSDAWNRLEGGVKQVEAATYKALP